MKSLLCLLPGLLAIGGCQRVSPPPTPVHSTSTKVPTAPKFTFEYKPPVAPEIPGTPVDCSEFIDVASDVNLNFTYDNGSDERVLMVESIGAGCGWLDYDRDGQWDLYFPQGGNATGTDRPGDALFRHHGGSFVNVTASADLVEHNYSQGVAVGDYNNDGFDDVFITNIEGAPDALFENLGDGTFRNVTASAGASDPLWSTSAAWADLDRDGDLDLYVCNYCQYNVASPIPCLKDGKPATCHPRDIPDVPDACYENLGDGTFRDVARDAGLHGPFNRGLAVAIADLNGDDWPDIYVANDTTANFLFLNERHFHFTESAYALGTAFDARGAAHASMGIALGDFDGDQRPDLCITGFSGEYNTLYRNRGDQGFQDMTGLTGLVELTTPKLGFGIVMADFNQDSHMELITANGHIGRDLAVGEGYEMSAQLVAFNGARWQDCTPQAGPYFSRKTLARGLATADYDQDGDLDVLVVHQNERVALLQNGSRREHWLNLELQGTVSNRRGIGARVVVETAASRWTQQLAAGTSFASTHQPLIAFGLGKVAGPVRVTVHWPSGTVQTVDRVTVDQSLTLREPPPGP